MSPCSASLRRGVSLIANSLVILVQRKLCKPVSAPLRCTQGRDRGADEHRKEQQQREYRQEQERTAREVVGGEPAEHQGALSWLICGWASRLGAGAAGSA